MILEFIGKSPQETKVNDKNTENKSPQETGVSYQDIIKKFGPDAEQVITHLLEKGDIFEPRAGFLKRM